MRRLHNAISLRFPPDGRELHAKLGSKAQCTNRFDDRVEQFQVIENKDFERFKENSLKPGRPKMQYRLTLKAVVRVNPIHRGRAGIKLTVF